VVDAAPVDGTSGTAVHQAGPGELLIDNVNGILYVQKGTLGSPVWDPVSSLTAAAVDFLSADATGRAKVETGFFDVATVDDTFAAGSIGEDRLTATELDLRVAQATGASLTSATIVGSFRFDVGGAGTQNRVLDEAYRVIDAKIIKTAAVGGAGDTIDISNAGSNIFPQIDLNGVADQTITRPTLLDDSGHEIAAAGTLRVVAAESVAVDCIVYVEVLRRP